MTEPKELSSAARMGREAAMEIIGKELRAYKGPPLTGIDGKPLDIQAILAECPPPEPEPEPKSKPKECPF